MSVNNSRLPHLSHLPPELASLLDEISVQGEQNDALVKERARKMLNITPDTGVFLSIQIQATGARRILEVGTSNGYSTLWLADAARRVQGHVTTLEVLQAKASLAESNFERSGLRDWISLQLGDATQFLKNCAADSFDFIFLDSDRKQYADWWLDLQRVLAPKGLLVVDNATSHAQEIAAFHSLVQKTQGYLNVLLPIGKGELVIFKC